jgi:hypothetical protein
LLQVKQIQWYRDYENVFKNDAISDDTWLKKIKRRDLLCNLCNHAARLLALEYEVFRSTSNSAKQDIAGHPP